MEKKFVIINRHCKNLSFLEEFLNRTKTSIADLANNMGMTRQALSFWLTIDDAQLSKVKQAINACGYDVKFSLISNEQQVMQTSIQLRDEDKLDDLEFLREAMSKYKFTIKDIADKLDVAYNSVRTWVNITNDIKMSQLYEIAEKFNLTLDIKITPKITPEM